MVFKRIWELIGQPAEAINKARLYDELMKSRDSVQARKTILILVKYTRLMNALFEDIRKLVPLNGTPRRVLYQGPPGSPIETLYDAVGEVEVVHNPPTVVEPGEGPRPWSIGKAPKRTHSSQPRRKSTRSERSGQGQSHVRQTPDRSRTLDRSRTPANSTPPNGKRLSEKGSPKHESLLLRSV